MSVYKPFTTTDLSITPFGVNKSFSFKGNELTGSNIDIGRYIGQNHQEYIWMSGSYQTGQVTIRNQQLIYNSIKQLYYSNFLTNISGSPASTASYISTPFIPDFPTAASEGVLIGKRDTTNYYNYLTSTININRSFPTGSNAKIGVVSIPSNLFGEAIQPGSFSFESPSGSIIDDSEGNLVFNSPIYSASNHHIGNIIYEHGIAVINQKLFGALDGYGNVNYGSSTTPIGIYGGIFTSFFINNNITCSFNSSITLYESQYKCTANPDEFLFSLNPTLISGSKPCPGNITNTLYDFATGSYFTPYVTTVGLYNNDKELVAVGKLAQPLDMSDTTDTTILINLDL
tara:strand:+ start:21327 stop:22355 length:1029 start_codon:yes stop_codon:yes gene_type:complete